MDYETPTIPRVTELVQKYVENLGKDYKYPYSECVYVGSDSKPACIIGHLIADISPEILGSIELHCNHDGFLSVAREYYGDDIDSDTIRFMAQLQYLQDAGVPWSIALEKAQEGLTPGDLLNFITYNVYGKKL
jgi:hypothetical protein